MGVDAHTNATLLKNKKWVFTYFNIVYVFFLKKEYVEKNQSMCILDLLDKYVSRNLNNIEIFYDSVHTNYFPVKFSKYFILYLKYGFKYSFSFIWI